MALSRFEAVSNRSRRGARFVRALCLVAAGVVSCLGACSDSAEEPALDEGDAGSGGESLLAGAGGAPPAHSAGEEGGFPASAGATTSPATQGGAGGEDTSSAGAGGAFRNSAGAGGAGASAAGETSTGGDTTAAGAAGEPMICL